MDVETRGIVALNAEEIGIVSGGTPAPSAAAIGRAFTWAGIAQTILKAGELAYEAGRWVGRQ